MVQYVICGYSRPCIVSFLRSFSSSMFNTQSTWFFPTVSLSFYASTFSFSHFSILKVLIRAMLNLDNVTSCFEIFTTFIKRNLVVLLLWWPTSVFVAHGFVQQKNTGCSCLLRNCFDTINKIECNYKIQIIFFLPLM